MQPLLIRDAFFADNFFLGAFLWVSEDDDEIDSEPKKHLENDIQIEGEHRDNITSWELKA